MNVLRSCKLYKDRSLNSEAIGSLEKGMQVLIPLLPVIKIKNTHWIHVYSKNLNKEGWILRLNLIMQPDQKTQKTV